MTPTKPLTPTKPHFAFVLLGVLVATAVVAAGYLAAAGDEPVVSIVTPVEPPAGGYTSIDGELRIEAAVAADAAVTSVAFFAGSTELGTDTTPPYTAVFDTSVWPDGQTSFIKAVATESSGNRSESLVYVQVVRGSSGATPDNQSPPTSETQSPPTSETQSPPTSETQSPSAPGTSAAKSDGPIVSIVTPVEPPAGGYTSIDGKLRIEAAVAANAPVTSVAFFAGSIDLGTDRTPPYTAVFDTSIWPNWQTSFIKAVATERSGNTSESLVYVQVVRASSVPRPDTQSPTVSLASPARQTAGRYTPIDGVLAVEATASDNVAVKSVDFYAGSIHLGTDSASPYQASFATSVWSNGQTSFIKAVAQDTSGNTSESLVYVQVVRGGATSAPATAPACSDKRDNDGDAKIDYPADPGCSSSTDGDEANSFVASACSDAKDNDGDARIDLADPGCANAADNDESNPTNSGPSLTWRPPALSNPVSINVPATGDMQSLDPSRDYILNLGHRRTGLSITGGRNVVMIGGRITCEDIVDDNLSRGRGIQIWDNAGVFHVEGVLVENCGDGMTISAPQSTIQLQNVRFDDVDSPYDLSHPDVIQTWRGPKEIRIDRLTADTSSKGFLWMSVNGTQPSRVDQRRVNLRLWSGGGAQSSALDHFTWHTSSQTRSTCDNCWTQLGWYSPSYQRRLQDSWGTFDVSGGNEFLPYRIVGRDGRRVDVETRAEHDALNGDSLGRRYGDYMERLVPSLAGERWYAGIPDSGDFVPGGSVGQTYVSPGYS